VPLEAATILVLVDAHESEFTIRNSSMRRASLDRQCGVQSTSLEYRSVRIRETPQRNYVSIDPDRLQKDDPILAIEQSEFHEPIRTFATHVRDAGTETDDIDDVLGIVVFGSVARGDADRQSDIDLFVVVDGDRTSARRVVTDVVADLSEQRFDGDRFDFEPYVRSAEVRRRAGPKLREIFTGA